MKINSTNISKQPLLGPDRFTRFIFRVLICSTLALNVTQQALAFSPLPPVDGPLATSITISSPDNILARPSNSWQSRPANQALKEIAELAEKDAERFHDAPHLSKVSRPDEARAARQPKLRWKE